MKINTLDTIFVFNYALVCVFIYLRSFPHVGYASRCWVIIGCSVFYVRTFEGDCVCLLTGSRLDLVASSRLTLGMFRYRTGVYDDLQ